MRREPVTRRWIRRWVRRRREAGAVYVREGLRGGKEGEEVWRAGRRRRLVHLRDVRVAQSHRVISGEMATVTIGNLNV